MKKKWWTLLLGATLVTAAFLFGGCSFVEGMFDKVEGLFQGEDSVSSSPDPIVGSVPITTAVKYEGAAEEGTRTVLVGEEYTLKAYDTEEYEFWFWELNGRNVSEEAEYTVTATKEATYYAVFKPKSEDEVLINVVYDRDEYARTWYGDTEISGGGYRQKGEALCLRSEDKLAASWFRVNNGKRARGPQLEMTAEENVTVTVRFEHVVEIVLMDSEHCELEIVSGEQLVELGWSEQKYYTVGCTLEEGYVADRWIITQYLSNQYVTENSVEKTSYTFESTANLSPEHAGHIHHNMVRIEVGMIATNENLLDTYNVEIVSEDGSSATVTAPEKFIHYTDYPRGYLADIYPDEDSYIQEVYLYIEAERNLGQGIAIVGDSVKVDFSETGRQNEYYLGGTHYVGDVSEFGPWENTTLCVKTIKRENAAIVNVISDDDWLVYTPDPNGGYAASMSTETFVVKKGESQMYHTRFDNNLNAIYKYGYQFSHISDEEGNVVSRTLDFRYSVTEDTDYYIRYSRKPIADPYLDYHLTEEGDGYAVRLSPMTGFYKRYVDFTEELTIPATYNGKPVVEIPDFGLSFYQTTGEMRDEYGTHIYGKLNVPASVKRIGKMAFANRMHTTIAIDKEAEFDYISPDAFYSRFDSVTALITKAQLTSMIKELHEIYIGDSTDFEVHFVVDGHFDDQNTLGHYESFAEYVCVKASEVTEISAYELSLIYHEFAHHYQFVAMVGVGEESYDTLQIRPTAEEVETWRQPYEDADEDYEAYWNHPMEVDARAFALQWTGFYQG